MGNAVAKADSQTTLSLLLKCISEQRVKDFQILCQNLHSPLPIHQYQMEIYTWLAIYAPSYNLDQMQIVTDCLCTAHKWLGNPVTNHLLMKDQCQTVNYVCYQLDETSQLTIQVGKQRLKGIHICLADSAIAIAHQIYNLIGSQYQQSLEPMSLLIQTLEALSLQTPNPLSYRQVTPPPISRNSNIVQAQLIHSAIADKNINAIAKLNPFTLPLINGLSVYHQFVLQSIFYNLTEIKELSQWIRQWQIHNNMNIQAQTKKYAGLIYLKGVYQWVQTDQKSYQDSYLRQKLYYQPLIRLHGMRALTLAYVVKFDLFLNRKFNFNLDLRVIDHVIETLSSH